MATKSATMRAASGAVGSMSAGGPTEYGRRGAQDLPHPAGVGHNTSVSARRRLTSTPSLTGDLGESAFEVRNLHCGWKVHLSDEHVEPTHKTSAQVCDVAAGRGEHTRDGGHDAEAVGAVQAQHVVLAFGRRLLVDAYVPHRHDERPVRCDRLESGLDLADRRFAGTDQGHREMTAQAGHRGVCEVEAEPGEDLGGVGDDPGPVVAEDSDGKLRHMPILAERAP